MYISIIHQKNKISIITVTFKNAFDHHGISSKHLGGIFYDNFTTEGLSSSVLQASCPMTSDVYTKRATCSVIVEPFIDNSVL